MTFTIIMKAVFTLAIIGGAIYAASDCGDVPRGGEQGD